MSVCAPLACRIRPDGGEKAGIVAVHLAELEVDGAFVGRGIRIRRGFAFLATGAECGKESRQEPVSGHQPHGARSHPPRFTSPMSYRPSLQVW